MKKLSLFVFVMFFLIGCGGGSSTPAVGEIDPVDNNPVEPTPSGKSLYIGYYLEDPATNPEDPVGGSIYLNIPDEDGAFDGSMYFTYVGCQSSNVGTVSGTKSGNTLTGNWSGTIDNTAQTGSYTGAYSAVESRYSGVYDVSAGKQFFSIDNCIEYYIAPNGTWFLYPQNTTKTFDGSLATSCTVINDVVSWFPPANYQYSLLSIIDTKVAESGAGTATVSQQIFATETSAPLPTNLVSGRTYNASVASVDSEGKVIYSCNTVFVKE